MTLAAPATFLAATSFARTGSVQVPPTAVPSSRGSRARLLPLLVLTLLLLLAAAAAIAVLAGAWQSERSSRRHLTTRLAASQASLALARTQLGTTEGRLADTRALSERQSEILAQTAVALRRVDPLPGDVARLQQVTGWLQIDRDRFSTGAKRLAADLDRLGKALGEAVYFGYDPSYLLGDIDNVTAEIVQVRSEAQTLSSHDADYAAASRTLGDHAGGITQSVRRLRRELKSLTGG